MTGKDEGIFDAINKGSFAAQGELLGFLGCDDILLPGALARVVQGYARGGRRWVVGGIRWIDGHGTPRGDLAAPPSWITVPMSAALGWNCIMHMATYVNSELFRDLGGFRKEMKYAGDYEFFLRALAIEPFADRPDPGLLPPAWGQPEHVHCTQVSRRARRGQAPVRPLPGVEEAIPSLFVEMLAQCN